MQIYSANFHAFTETQSNQYKNLAITFTCKKNFLYFFNNLILSYRTVTGFDITDVFVNNELECVVIGVGGPFCQLTCNYKGFEQPGWISATIKYSLKNLCNCIRSKPTADTLAFGHTHLCWYEVTNKLIYTSVQLTKYKNTTYFSLFKCL